MKSNVKEATSFPSLTSNANPAAKRCTQKPSDIDSERTEVLSQPRSPQFASGILPSVEAARPLYQTWPDTKFETDMSHLGPNSSSHAKHQKNGRVRIALAAENRLSNLKQGRPSNVACGRKSERGTGRVRLLLLSVRPLASLTAKRAKGPT